MPEYLSPGVYVEEVDRGPRTIMGVSSSVAGFVGAPPDAGARTGEAVPVMNWAQFRSIFVREGDASTPLANAVYGFFLNGGSRAYVVNPGAGDASAALVKGLEVLEKQEVSLIAAPGLADAASYDALLTSAERTGDRFAVLGSPMQVEDVMSLTKVARPPRSPAAGDGEGGARGPARSEGLRARQSDDGCGAQVAFGIIARDCLDPSKIVEMDPCGHVLGCFARTDSARGVHKAPANVTLRGALDVTRPITRAEQAVLNPAGVNCIKMFPGEGVKLYGARTLAAESSPNRYVSVKRLMMLIRLSIERGTNWVVFEPNDALLWAKIRRDVGAFLTILWRQGALMGATPEEAFYVKCDAETNPSETIDAGQVITEIGVAPVKPAEFVIFRIGQSPSGQTLEAA